MKTWQKSAVALSVTLTAGVVGGYVLGIQGKTRLQESLLTATKSTGTMRGQLGKQRQELRQAREACRSALGFRAVKEALLRGLVETHGNNFGATSKHLGAASAKIKALRASFDPGAQRNVDVILDEITKAHDQSMALDPMVRVRVEKLVELVHTLPGGH